jgi:hypothetical protein
MDLHPYDTECHNTTCHYNIGKNKISPTLHFKNVPHPWDLPNVLHEANVTTKLQHA